jgi:hypothetical protein
VPRRLFRTRLRVYESLTAGEVDLYALQGICDFVKRLLLLVVLLVVVLPGTANAAGSPCRNKVVADWYRDGKIASTYPIGCYRDALKHIPADADIYSSLRGDVNAALRAATRRSKGLSAPLQVGHGSKATGAHNVKVALVSIDATKKLQGQPSSTGVVATATGAPLPILVLGGIALALAAAGAIGVGVRHARGRRPR